MDFKQLCAELRENTNKVRYWDLVLKKHELIYPQKALNKDIYSTEDVAKFKTLQEYLKDRATTATEAVNLMKNNVTPNEALQQFQRAQRQIEVLQQKVVALRKPFWTRLKDWFGAMILKLKPKAVRETSQL